LNLTFFIILFSFLVSNLSGTWVLKRKQNKWLGMCVSFCINTFILSITTIILYKLDAQMFHKQTEGLLESLGILVLVFFIPILTLINFYILEFKRSRMIHS
jgi:hypothetical protein